MTFTARIRRASPVYRHWIEQHLRRASLCAVPFIRTAGNDFVFDGGALSTDQVATLQHNPCVDLEAYGLFVESSAVPSDEIHFRDPETGAHRGAIVNLGVADTNMGDVKEPAVYVPPAQSPQPQRYLSRAERRRLGQ